VAGEERARARVHRCLVSERPYYLHVRARRSGANRARSRAPCRRVARGVGATRIKTRCTDLALAGSPKVRQHVADPRASGCAANAQRTPSGFLLGCEMRREGETRKVETGSVSSPLPVPKLTVTWSVSVLDARRQWHMTGPNVETVARHYSAYHGARPKAQSGAERRDVRRINATRGLRTEPHCSEISRRCCAKAVPRDATQRSEATTRLD
jgi:hypothetical protein